MSSAIDTKSVNSIRVLAADAIQKANSGHPGLPLGSAPMAYELWANHMNHNPKDPKWENRDRFILSGWTWLRPVIFPASLLRLRYHN